jgi:succinate-semialdehyde dehydrogenase/glutarate-semialdehyde dehydrogenase
VATHDLRTAIRCAEELEAGIVAINDFSPATVLSPFGGIKQSGIGREGGREGIMEYMESKAISLSLE